MIKLIEKALDGFALGFMVGMGLGVAFAFFGFMWVLREPIGG